MRVDRPAEQVSVVRLSDGPRIVDELMSLEVPGGGDHAVLDFTDVNFVNSTVLSRLISLRQHKVTFGRKMVLCGLNETVHSVLKVTGLERVFETANDVDTAVRSVNPT